MKKFVVALGILGSAVVWSGSAVTVEQATAAAAPTFNKDIAPIFYANCTSCHRPTDIAPMSLLTYKDARPWAKSIASKVADGTMPPWHADPKYGKWVGERRLTDAQKSTIIVTGSRRPTFQAYTQKAPVRVVLDLVKSQLQNVPAAQPATPKELTAGVLVTDVRTQQMGTAGRELARVEIVFADDIDYVVDADGTALKLTATRRINPAVLAAEAAAA